MWDQNAFDHTEYNAFDSVRTKHFSTATAELPFNSQQTVNLVYTFLAGNFFYLYASNSQQIYPYLFISQKTMYLYAFKLTTNLSLPYTLSFHTKSMKKY